MAHKLFVGGLNFATSNERLRELFAECGQVESATVVTDRDTGRSRGFGFVEMGSAEEAEQASPSSMVRRSTVAVFRSRRPRKAARVARVGAAASAAVLAAVTEAEAAARAAGNPALDRRGGTAVTPSRHMAVHFVTGSSRSARCT